MTSIDSLQSSYISNSLENIGGWAFQEHNSPAFPHSFSFSMAFFKDNPLAVLVLKQTEIKDPLWTPKKVVARNQLINITLPSIKLAREYGYDKV